MKKLYYATLVLGFLLLTIFGFSQTCNNTWIQIGSGLETPVNVQATTTFGTDLIVAGSGDPNRTPAVANYSGLGVFKWNGKIWTKMGGTFSGDPTTTAAGIIANQRYGSIITSLTVFNGVLFAAGNFKFAYNTSNNTQVTIKSIAKWNPAAAGGGQWEPAGNGANGYVFCLHEYVNASGVATLLAGGRFDFGNLPIGEVGYPGSFINLAKWDGTTWTTAGFTFNNDSRVAAMTTFEDKLVIGGNFTTMKNTATSVSININRIASINFSNSIIVTPLGNGITNSTGGGMVQALDVTKDDLFIGGSFNTANNSTTTSLTANNIVRWRTSQYYPLLDAGYNGVIGQIFSLKKLQGSNDIYIGGVDLKSTGGSSGSNITKWNGAFFSNFNRGLGSSITTNNSGLGVRSIIFYKGDIITGGEFNTALTGLNQVLYVAKWSPQITISAPSVCQGTTSAFTCTSNPTLQNYTWTFSGGYPNSALAAPKVLFNASGNYSTTLTSSGCTTTITAIVNAKPTISFLGGLIRCDDEVDPTLITAIGADTYLWNTGATTSDLLVSPTSTTTYNVIGTTTNGCSTVANHTLTVTFCKNSQLKLANTYLDAYPSSKIDQTLFEKINISPNPNVGLFSLEMPKGDSKSVYVYDSMDKIIYTKQEVSEQRLEVDIQEFPRGIYTVKVISKNKVQNKRLIKE